MKNVFDEITLLFLYKKFVLVYIFMCESLIFYKIYNSIQIKFKRKVLLSFFQSVRKGV